MIRIDGYPMDLALSEDHSFPGEATEFPVESGADISDHIRAMPEEITLECIVSDSPIGEVANDPTRQASGPDAPLPSTDAYQKLREIRTARRPVTIETSLGVFESMALIDLSIPKSKDTGGGLFFTATFKRVNIVTNRRTRVRVKTPMAGAGGKAKVQAKALAPIDVDRTIWWMQGIPPGAPWKAGNAVIRVFQGRRTKPEGFTREELVAISGVDPNASSRGQSLVDYFEAATGRPILGAEREHLIADLRRDMAARREAESKDLQRSLSEDPQGTFRKMQNLPSTISSERFLTPPEPTLPAQPATPVIPGFGR